MEAPTTARDLHLPPDVGLAQRPEGEPASIDAQAREGFRHAPEQSRSAPRWDAEVDIASLSTTRPRAWRQDVSHLPRSFLRQILGLNPFRTSYFSLYRPLKDVWSRSILASGVILAIAAGVPLPLIGVVFGKIINTFPPPEDELRTRLLQLIGIACAYFVTTWGWSICWGVVGERVSRGLREALVERALGMDMAFFDVESPDMTNILTEQTQTVQLGTSEKVGLFIQSISYFLAAFVVGLILDAKLTGILLAGIIPSMLFVVCFGSKSVSRLAKRASECTENASQVAESAIKGVQVVQAFGILGQLTDDHRDHLRKAARIGLQKSISGALMLACVYFVAYSANALAFWQGSRQAREERSTEAGTIYAVVFLILDASFVVGQFGPFIQTFALAASAGGKIFALLDHPDPHIDVYSDEGEKPTKASFCDELQFREVTFVYPARPAVRVLDGLNLVFKSGAMTGVVGASGSGKSTVASLLLRLYDPSSGKVSVGGKDIRHFHIRSLRSHIAVVDQEPLLFSGTIMDNIVHGLGDDHGLSCEEVRDRCLQAVKEASCDFIADLPLGMETPVSGSGIAQLSGGQKQRLCLARALAGRPALLILDEYTSAMDAANEAKVLEYLKESSKTNNRTTIVIAHRLATIKDADQIMVMDSGALVECGTHESLMDRNGTYTRLVQAQQFGSQTGSSESTSTSLTSAAKFSEAISSVAGEKQRVSTEEEPAVDEREEKLSAWQVIKRCLELSKPEFPFVLIGLLASMMTGAAIIGEAIIFGSLVDALETSPESSDFTAHVNFLCLMFFVIAIIALLAYSVSGTAFGFVSEKLVLRVRDISLQTILKQDLAWFSEEKRSPHSLMSTINMDSGHLSGLSGVILGTLFSATTSVIGGIILAHIIAWKIAIVLLAAVPVMLLAGFMRLRVLSKGEQRHQTAYNDAAALASEACSSIRTVATLGREKDVLRMYKQAILKPYEQSLKFITYANSLLAFSLSVTYFVYALAYWWGARQVREGNYSLLEFFIVLPALLFSAQAAGQMFSLGPEITRAKTAAQSVFKLHDQKPSIMFQDTATAMHQLHASSMAASKNAVAGQIDFQDVYLTYANRSGFRALNGVSFSITPGEIIAFVGRSGAGKSSSISLLERFYDPSSGSILVDGEDIRRSPVHEHRARIGLVAQEPDLFPGSVLFNVGLGARPGTKATHENVVEACKKCGIHDFIMGLPEGYNTECGNNGSNLSGGQKQRIAIARAVVRDPEILLLDEATSQLDAHSEHEVREAIVAASSGRTTIVVAHRLASVQNAHRIFVFDEGRIVEQGSHAELVACRGIYAAMVEAQGLS